jgi:hypothetical protein
MISLVKFTDLKTTPSKKDFIVRKIATNPTEENPDGEEVLEIGKFISKKYNKALNGNEVFFQLIRTNIILSAMEESLYVIK